MKKILFGISILLLAGSCSGNGNSEITKDDSINKEDTSISKEANDTISNTSKETEPSSEKEEQEATQENEKNEFTFKDLTSKFYSKKKDISRLSKNQTMAAMTELGFNYQGSSYAKIATEFGDMDAENLKFKEPGIDANVYVDSYGGYPIRIVLKFDSSTDAAEFLTKSVMAMGGTLKKSGNSYIYLKGITYWAMSQNGSKIVIEIEESEDGGESYN